MKATYVNCKLYLEGIQVPFDSISIIETQHSPSIAQISFPANAGVLNLRAKTQVAVFYLIDGVYYLIFQGELKDVGFTRTHSQRTVSVGAVGYSDNLNYVYKQKVSMSLANLVMGNFLVLNTPGHKEASSIDYLANVDQQNITMSDFQGLDLISTLHRILTDLGQSDDIEAAFKMFFSDLEKFNPYFSYVYNNQKFAGRLLGFKNSKALDILRKQQTLKWVLNQFEYLADTATAKMVVDKWLQFLNYELVEIAAPTLGTDGAPKSFIFKPSTEFLAPIKPNVIFPDQVSNISARFDKLSTPTRLAATTRSLILENGPSTAFDLNLVYVAPNVEYNTDESKLSIKLTQEEKIRGIVPLTFQYDSIERAYIELNGAPPDPSTDSIDYLSEKNLAAAQGKTPEYPMTDYARKIIDYRFFLERYKRRNLSFQTDYSPYRLVGFPMVYIDDVLPAIVGTIETIQHTIHAGGRATSSIKVSYPRIHWTEDFPTEFSANEDSAPKFPEWFDESYSAASIGSEHYSGVTDGILDRPNETSDGSILDYASDTNVAVDDATLLGSAIKNLKDRWASLPDNLKQNFAVNVTKRNLISEEQYWMFLTGETFPDRAKHYISSEEITLESIATINNKPFIEERAARVDELI